MKFHAHCGTLSSSETTRKPLNPTKPFEEICKINEIKHYAWKEQQDASELLDKLITHWSKRNAAISELFQGSSLSKLQCSGCGRQTEKWDSWSALRLSIVKAKKRIS